MVNNLDFFLSQSWNSGQNTPVLLDMPPEILLHILSYLDLPDLWKLTSLNSPFLNSLTADHVLHYQRVWLVSPSRVNHGLFGKSKEGHLLRPSVVDLVRRGVMKGLGIERRRRMGLYIYSLDSILQYENSRVLSRRHAQQVLAHQFTRRMVLTATPNDGQFYEPRVATTDILPISDTTLVVNRPPKNSSIVRTKHATFNAKLYLLSLYSTHVLPDIEVSSPGVARSLLPTMRKLKWCLQKDRLAREFKRCGKAVAVGLGIWLSEGEGEMTFDDGVEREVEKKRMRKRIFGDGEKVRLALCPDVKQRVGFFEKLGRGELKAL